VTTPNEMARLFELLARGKAVNAKADSEMVRILEHTDSDLMLLRYAGGPRFAHKNGATDQVRTECGLFFLRNRIAVCVMTKENKDTRWIVDNEPHLTVARMGEAIVKAWGGAPRATPP
jgi:beta-lactamase class A